MMCHLLLGHLRVCGGRLNCRHFVGSFQGELHLVLESRTLEIEIEILRTTLYVLS